MKKYQIFVVKNIIRDMSNPSFYAWRAKILVGDKWIWMPSQVRKGPAEFSSPRVAEIAAKTYLRNVKEKIGLTGNVRFRRGWFNKLILQVEYGARSTGIYPENNDGPYYTAWRDATPMDRELLVEISDKIFELTG